MNDQLSLKPTRVTQKGHDLMKEYQEYEQSYPDRGRLKEWIQVEKDMYSNGADND